MLETAYVVTWRWSDGSGSGATAGFIDKARAESLLKVLAADQCSRVYKIEAVPFDGTAGVAGTPLLESIVRIAEDDGFDRDDRLQQIVALIEHGTAPTAGVAGRENGNG